MKVVSNMSEIIQHLKYKNLQSFTSPFFHTNNDSRRYLSENTAYVEGHTNPKYEVSYFDVNNVISTMTDKTVIVQI